jgi:hypothetical protein
MIWRSFGGKMSKKGAGRINKSNKMMNIMPEALRYFGPSKIIRITHHGIIVENRNLEDTDSINHFSVKHFVDIKQIYSPFVGSTYIGLHE